jgi:hypothetical protein
MRHIIFQEKNIVFYNKMVDLETPHPTPTTRARTHTHTNHVIHAHMRFSSFGLITYESCMIPHYSPNYSSVFYILWYKGFVLDRFSNFGYYSAIKTALNKNK